jgi:hypothetical protein
VGTLWMPCSKSLLAMRLTVEQLLRRRVFSMESPVYLTKYEW